ncbi:hypothetical protein HUT19_23135 [Streptomyces sp. NA02950]|nr:hypothetical protein HUT19_23135 [Streptomyces sp. NA02950]
MPTLDRFRCVDCRTPLKLTSAGSHLVKCSVLRSFSRSRSSARMLRRFPFGRTLVTSNTFMGQPMGQPMGHSWSIDVPWAALFVVTSRG